MRAVIHIIILVVVFLFESDAQRISFNTYVQGENINTTFVENPQGLNFNLKQPQILVGEQNIISVDLADNAVVVLEIEAPMDYDINVQFLWPTSLSLGGLGVGTTIPASFRVAYNNTGESNDVSRRSAAVIVPPLFSSLTFPIRRRTFGGPSMPPPTPEHGGYIRERARAYLYIYGNLGPIPSNIPSGNYSNEISLTISYANNDL